MFEVEFTTMAFGDDPLAGFALQLPGRFRHDGTAIGGVHRCTYTRSCRLPEVAVGGSWTGQRVGNFMQDSMTNFGVIIELDKVSRERDFPFCIVAGTTALARMVQAYLPVVQPVLVQ